MKHHIVLKLTLLIIALQACTPKKPKMNCENAGPQTPRDIDSYSGTNKTLFAQALPISDMNLCNIHFHKNAEHKAKDFPIYAGDGDKGYNSGYQCTMSKHLSEAELAPTKEKICHSKLNSLLPGDTIEVHWVLSSCDVKPAPTLGACSSASCINPQLRVETQVFTLVNDTKALNFNQIQRASDLPQNTGTPVEFLGSTTGPSFSDTVCSPLQVTWSVRPKCAKLDINSVGKWCKDNIFDEGQAHGVRKLVIKPELLSKIKK